MRWDRDADGLTWLLVRFVHCSLPLPHGGSATWTPLACYKIQVTDEPGIQPQAGNAPMQQLALRHYAAP